MSITTLRGGPRPAGPELAAQSMAVATIAIRHPWQRRWLLAFVVSLGLVGVLVASLFWLLARGVGIWGNNVPVTWALDIICYDWWVGIASGGLLVSACLLLTDAPARGALNRIGETMSLAAVGAAALYPIIHLGRPWFFYWNLPYPNRLDLWPQFRSPLVWDAMALVSTLGLGLCFWYVGLLPDLALLRDRAANVFRARVYGIASLGWRGSARHWARWAAAQRVQAMLGLLLVTSLQAGAAVMFAGSIEPGWHDPLLPVLFVAGAVMSGVAAMALGAVVTRAVFGLHATITHRQLDLLGGLLLAAGIANTYCYAAEFFTMAYGGDRYELMVLQARLTGIYAWSTWMILGCALAPIHLLWFANCRRSGPLLALISLLVLAGLWADRFMVIVITLHHDFLPSSEHFYTTTIWAVATFVGTIGLFMMLGLLFLRYLPVVSMVELRRAAPHVPHAG